MKYKDIKNLEERRKENMSTPTHIMQRYELEELRAYIEGCEWVGLTDEEVYRIVFTLEGEHWKKISDAIEAKLKEKNA